jgi:hypothetical protein
MLTAANNIVLGNSASGSADDIDGGYSDAGGNLVGYSGGVPVNTAAVNLSPLANYGGTTQTMLPEPGSPAICAGLLSNVPSGTTTDQRGWPMNSACVDAGSVQTNYSIINTLADSLNTADTASCTDGSESATNTCSLRDAISQANAASYADVGFAPSLFVSASSAAATPGTIALGFGSAGEIPLPEVTGTLNLFGPGATLITVSGDNDSNVGSILQFASTATGYVGGMTFANGLQSKGSNGIGHGGGAIANQGTLTVQNDVFTGNQSQDISGGAIVNSGTINILDSTFSANTSGNYGGAFFNCCEGTATVVNSTFTGNTSASDGGAIFSFWTLTVDNSTVTGNTAKAGSGGGINTYCAGATSAIYNSIVAGNSATGLTNLKDVGYADPANCSASVPPAESGDLVGLPKGITNVSQILGTLDYSPVTAAVPVMLPLPGATSIFCQGSASLLPAGVTTDERGFPMDPQCSSGAIDLGAAQTNYTGIAFTAPPYGVAGQTITPAPSIRVKETNALTSAVDGAGGMPVSWWLTGYPSPFTVSLLTPKHGLGTTKPIKSNGVTDNLLNLPGLSVSTAGTYTLTTQIGTATQESNSFIIDAATVTQLVFTTPPASAISAGAAQPAVRVALESVDGVPITSATGSITLNVTGPNGYTNSYTVAAVSGTATFSPKVLTIEGNYTYQAYLDGNTGLATSAVTQYVAPLGAVRLVVSGYPSPWYSGVPANATVSVFDKYGNLTTSSVNATISTTGPKSVINPAQVTISGSTLVSVTFASVGTGTITATLATATSGIAVAPERNIIIETVPKFVVNSGGDAGAGASDCTANPTATGAGMCTLRDALAAAGNYGAGTVTFDATVFAAANATAANTITLTQGVLNIQSSTSINGPGAGLLTVSGANASTVFYASNFNVAISGLTITNGNGNAGECFSGGIEVDYGTLTLTNSIVTGNSGSYGAGICIYSGTLTVTNSTVTGNTGAEGGGILNWGGTGTVTNSTVSQNYANYGYGGGIASWYSYTTPLTVTGSTITGNSASEDPGGGIENYEGTLIVANSTISGNAAYDDTGGGIDSEGGTVTVTGSTVTGNSAPSGYGSGIENAYGSLSVANSILDGNGGDDLDDTSGASSLASGQSCSQEPTCDAGGNMVGYFNGNALNTTPIDLAPLANYGGSLQTMIPLPGSPAICAGVAANIPAGVTKDERGLPNTNTTYPGYSANNACVDSGAVQTRYSLALTPKSMSATTGKAMTPAPVVTLSESGKAAPYATGTVNMSDANSVLDANSTTSVALTAGVATFSNLVFDTSRSDSLTASLALNLGPQPLVTLSQTGAPFTVAGQKQTITISWSPTGTQYAGASATLSATTTSGLAATFSTSSANCTVNGSTVSYSTGGSCVITATVPANSIYAAATASKTITVALNSQTITFSWSPTGTQYAGKTATLTGTATSGQTVTFGTNSSNCTVNGNTVNYSAAGSCVITATVPANSMYAAATANKTITVALATQTITFTMPTAQQHVGGSATQGTAAGPNTFVAKANSGLPVTLTALTSNCSVTGDPGSLTISFTATGTCTIAASQAGDQTVWAAASGIAKSTTVANALVVK